MPRPWHVMACHGMPCHVMVCYGIPWRDMAGYAMSRHGMPWHALEQNIAIRDMEIRYGDDSCRHPKPETLNPKL